MAASSSVAPPTNFGNVQFFGNLNLEADGERNFGEIIENVNLNVSSSASRLRMIYNVSGEMRLEQSILTCSDCVKLTVHGKKNLAVLRNNIETIMIGDENDVEAMYNTKLNIRANGSALKISDNTETTIDIIGGNHIARKNVNLIISGTDGQVNIKRTKNHELRPANGTSMNRMQFVPQPNGVVPVTNRKRGHNRGVAQDIYDWLSTLKSGLSTNTTMEYGPSGPRLQTSTSELVQDAASDSEEVGHGITVSKSNDELIVTTLGNRTKGTLTIKKEAEAGEPQEESDKIKFILDYVDEAEIDGPRYQLGIFEFSVDSVSDDCFRVFVDEIDYDEGSFERRLGGTEEITVTAASNGVRQSIQFSAPLIRLVGSSIYIHMDPTVPIKAPDFKYVLDVGM